MNAEDDDDDEIKTHIHTKLLPGLDRTAGLLITVPAEVVAVHRYSP